MKIHAYKVVAGSVDTQPLEQRLAERDAQSLGERLYNQNGVKLRLENHQQRDGLVELNFVSFRLSTAPVRLAEDRPLAEIKIDDDESFGEETACLYHPPSRFMLIQYNHYGPRSGAIRDYLSYREAGKAHNYTFAAKLSASSEQRIRNLGVVSRVDVAIAIPDLPDDAKYLSVDSAINLARANGAQRLELALASRQGLVIRSTMDWLLGIYSHFSQGDIQKLTVRGSEGEDSPRETIDLLSDRLCLDLPIAHPAGRRLPLELRLEALHQAFTQWSQEGQFV